MAADSPRRRGQPPAWKAAAGAADDRRGPQYKWKPADDARPGTGRRLKQLLLLGGTLACLTGIVWLILYLWPTPQPCLVAVAADPARDADRLDVPLDLYGWRTAREFLQLGQERAGRSTQWVGKPPAPPTDDGNPLALPETEAGLPDWANRLKGFDPLVVYVGLHGGTDGAGQPFLFTGGGHRLPVADLLNALSTDPLRKKRKVLILDCGRLPPDPVYGQLHDDFAERVKGLNQAVRDCPNLVVLCGASPGQRGWESEELRQTAFGHAVLRALRGEVDTGARNVVTARALFESARQKTRQWAQENRPVGQEPFLLPEGDEGLARAEKIDLGPRPTPPPAGPPPAAAPLPAALDQLWREHDALADRVPGPAAYAPRAWRRYRELLLRYEQAARLGEKETADKLTTALGAARKAIEDAPVAPGRIEGSRNSVALWAAVHGGAVPPVPPGVSLANDPAKTTLPPQEPEQIATADRLLQLLAGAPDRLDRAAALLRKFDPDRRPAEAHLPVMVADFYATVLDPPQTPPGEWAAAVALRRSAERAAAGLPTQPAESGHAALYPERVWPLTRHAVLAGDAKRRQAEDALFASDPKAREAAAELMKQAGKDYAEAAEIAAAARAAFDARDTVLADLPFLTRWYAERAAFAEDKDVAELTDLWEKVHGLADDLDDLEASPPAAGADPKAAADFLGRVKKLGADAGAVRSRFGKLLQEFRAEAERRRADAALQTEWWAKQQLLAAPLIRADWRRAVLEASRQASAGLLAGQLGQKSPSGATKVEPKQAAEVRRRLALAALGDRLLDAQHEADKQLPKAAALAQNPDLAVVGDGLLRHLARLSAARPAPAPEPDARAERFSRSAVPFAADAGWEPAAANHRLRWRALLTALADRTATDHWYDEKQSPVFKTVAARYLADADRMTEELAKGAPPGATGAWAAPPPQSLADKLNAKPLAARDLGKIVWTSDLTRAVEFAPEPLPKDYPIAGDAVGVVRLTGSKFLRVAEPVRRPQPIRDGRLRVSADLRLDPKAEEVTELGCESSAIFYFRGQRPTQKVRIDLRRKPELIVTDRPPAGNPEPFVAVRADRDLPLGSVVILLDYSGSMDGPLPKGKTRKDAALDAVAALLKELPRGTPLRVRVFSDEKEPRGSRVVFGAGGEGDRPEVTWESDQDPRYKDLMATLRGLKPHGFTPLVQSILDAARNDFPRRPGSKTLLVLTDGAEEDEVKREGDALAKFLADRGGRLADGLDGEGVSVQVVQLALSKDELAQSAALFRPLLTRQPELVRLWPADTGEQLRQHLLDALRPKLRLTDRLGDVVLPEGFRSGWPSRPATRREPPYASDQLYWSPRFKAENPRPYHAAPNPGGQASAVELDLRDGELMILSFARDSGRVRVRRELYADYYPDRVQTRRGDQGWVLTVPGNAVDDTGAAPEYRSLAFLEQVPPHRRGKGDRADDATVLSFAHPDLTWWQVTPVVDKGEKPPATGTVRVTRSYGYPAPGWEVRARDWPLRPRPAPADFKVWAADAAPGAWFETVRPGETRDVIGPAGDKLRLSAQVETWPPDPDPAAPPRPPGVLVVRFACEQGKPVFAKPVDAAADYAEHRYYGDGTGADGMVAYTAVFRLPEERLRAGVRLKLIPVQPSRTDANLLKLTPPAPGLGVDLGIDPPPQPYKTEPK